MKNVMRSMYGLAGFAMLREAAGEGSAGAEVATKSTRFTADQVAEIRKLRAQRHPDGHEKAGKPVHTHAGLAALFNTKAGVISQIVRNRSHKDPNYTPINDGK